MVKLEACLAAILDTLQSDSASGEITPPIMTFQRYPESGARYPLVMVEPTSEGGGRTAQNVEADVRVILHVSLMQVQLISTEAINLAQQVRQSIERHGKLGGCELQWQRTEFGRWKLVNFKTETETPITEVAILYRAIYHEDT